jgi:MFS transporter, ACS family, DAL5 transporter family protein
MPLPVSQGSSFCLAVTHSCDITSLAVVTLLWGYYSDKMKKRYPFILTGLFMLLIGFSIQISDAPRGVKYFGTFFCVAGSYASFPGVVAW